VTANTPTGTDVPVSTVISVTFDEAMNETSVEDAFSIDPSVTGSVSWDGNTMTFTPDADLAYETTYNVTIGTGAEDLAGNPLAEEFVWNFTTGSDADTTPPTVTANTPTGTDVPVSTVISVTFDEAMNETSAEDAFSIDPSVTGSVSWDGNMMTFTPDSNLVYDTTYNVTIGTGAEDLAGNPLAEEFVWNFTTRAAPVADRFVILDLADGTVGTPITVTVEVRDQYEDLVAAYQDNVTLNASGSATGDGLVNIVNGTGSLDISDTVAETVTLSLNDTEETGLNVSSKQQVTFAARDNGGSSSGSGSGGTYPPGWGEPAPTSAATPAPTAAPEPTVAPTEAPTVAPTEAPTKAPTVAPTETITTKMKTEGTPGFGAVLTVFAIAGLLVAAYLVMRRRE
jgi:cell division septation protein DedD